MIFQLYIVQVGQLKTGGIEKMGDISCLYEKGNGAIHLVLKLRKIDPQFFSIFMKIREIKRSIELCQIVVGD